MHSCAVTTSKHICLDNKIAIQSCFTEIFIQIHVIVCLLYSLFPSISSLLSSFPLCVCQCGGVNELFIQADKKEDKKRKRKNQIYILSHTSIILLYLHHVIFSTYYQHFVQSLCSLYTLYCYLCSTQVRHQRGERERGGGADQRREGRME